MRAFIAVDLSEGIRNKIKEIQAEFGNLSGGAKFVDATKTHITLKFLGDIQENSVEEIGNALSEINQKSFDMALRGVGFFPEASLQKAKRIRIIWIGVEKGVEELRTLQEGVELRMTGLGFLPEKKFSAHVTICRVKKITKDEIGMALKKIVALRDVEVGKMLVDKIKLKKSTLTPKGPIYEDVYIKGLDR
jgi:2'-5' RNA ligase